MKNQKYGEKIRRYIYKYRTIKNIVEATNLSLKLAEPSLGSPRILKQFQ